jgi:uncharacterized protein YutE (UPF0331/DUF86 family)
LVDTSSVSARLEHLGELLTELDAIRGGGRDAYAAEWRTRLAAEHALQLAIQTCIDVGLDASLAERLAAAAGMRNILVHGYLDVDDEAVWSALGRLGDLRDFAATVQRIADSGKAEWER